MVIQTCAWIDHGVQLPKILSSSAASVARLPRSATQSTSCASKRRNESVSLVCFTCRLMTYLNILWVDGHGNALHALGISCAQNLSHRKTALEILRLVTKCLHASLDIWNCSVSVLSQARVLWGWFLHLYLWDKDSTQSAVCNAFVTYYDWMWAGVSNALQRSADLT